MHGGSTLSLLTTEHPIFALFCPCGRGGVLKNPSLVMTSTSEFSAFLSPTLSPMPLIPPSLPHSYTDLTFLFPIVAVAFFKVFCCFRRSSGKSTIMEPPLILPNNEGMQIGSIWGGGPCNTQMFALEHCQAKSLSSHSKKLICTHRKIWKHHV